MTRVVSPRWLLSLLAASVLMTVTACSREGSAGGGRDKEPYPSGSGHLEPAGPALGLGNQPSPPGAQPARGATGGLSTPPTVAEWSAAAEVTVKGSSALGCETKVVREWFRVSCRGKNDAGGTPTAVVVSRGGGPNTFTHTAGGVTSLVTPFVEGTYLEARFSWTDRDHKLVVSWPRGAPRPPLVGVFEGARSPMDTDRPPPDGSGLPTCRKRAHCKGKEVCCRNNPGSSVGVCIEPPCAFGDPLP